MCLAKFSGSRSRKEASLIFLFISHLRLSTKAKTLDRSHNSDRRNILIRVHYVLDAYRVLVCPVFPCARVLTCPCALV